MKAIIKYNQDIRDLFESSNIKELYSMLDFDSIDQILRKYLSLEKMREYGSFFTGQDLATKSVTAFKTPITINSVILDPTCGAGNLLIECSRKLIIKKTLSETLKLWGRILYGFDIHPHFIEATKLRIVIEAVTRGVEVNCSINDAIKLLPNVRIQDALLINKTDLTNISHIIMNPPFTIWPSPQKYYWKNGKVNAAGIIFDLYLRLLPENANISAILPDVLRSGSRYNDFRNFISSRLNAKCSTWGRFNSKTDVDVFILSGIKIQSVQKKILWHQDFGKYERLSEKYDVRVGPLVAYRDPQIGTKYPYFHPKNCAVWQEIKDVTETRLFNGKVLTPPFIVVKRTSSPSDKNRASATIINLKQPVAIENHMIVIKPKSGTLKDCRRLLKILSSQKTNDFLNERARMRHLTVGVIKDIPIK